MVNAMHYCPKFIMKRKNRELLKTPGSFYVDETCCFSAFTLALLFALYSVTFSMVSPSIWSAPGLVKSDSYLVGFDDVDTLAVLHMLALENRGEHDQRFQLV